MLRSPDNVRSFRSNRARQCDSTKACGYTYRSYDLAVQLLVVAAYRRGREREAMGAARSVQNGQNLLTSFDSAVILVDVSCVGGWTIWGTLLSTKHSSKGAWAGASVRGWPLLRGRVCGTRAWRHACILRPGARTRPFTWCLPIGHDAAAVAPSTPSSFIVAGRYPLVLSLCEPSSVCGVVLHAHKGTKARGGESHAL